MPQTKTRWGLTAVLALASALLAFGQTPIPAYRLEAGDSLEVRFYYSPELNDHMTIRPDGYISLGLIGSVSAAGKTIPELTAYLEDKYAQTLKHPSISIQVVAFANRRVFVGGEVNRPGALALTGEETVLDAIVEAGGLTKLAHSKDVILIRRSPAGQPEVHHVGLRSSDKGPAEAATFFLDPFDVVLAPESGISKANRAVDQYVLHFLPPQISLGFSYLINHGLLF